MKKLLFCLIFFAASVRLFGVAAVQKTVATPAGELTQSFVVPEGVVIGTPDPAGYFASTNMEAMFQEIGAQLRAVAPTPNLNYLFSGGGVGFVSGLQLDVAAATYSINGQTHVSPLAHLSSTTADPTNARIDVVVVDSSNVASIITGTPGATPVKPQIDPTTQLELTFYTLAANATVLPVSIVDIYHENTEWTTSRSGTTFTLASTNNPYRGTVDIEGTNVTTGNSFTFTKPVSGTFDIGASDNFIFYVAPKAGWPSTRSISINLLSSNTVKGATVVLKNGTFGLNTGSTAYQQISIPTSTFVANGILVNKIRFQVGGTGATFGAYFDDFTLQGGLAQTVDSSRMKWRSAYQPTLTYNANDTVLYNGKQYVAKTSSQGATPVGDITDNFWDKSSDTVFTVTGPIAITNNVSTIASQTGTGTKFVVDNTPTINTATLSGITTQIGTTILTPSPMSALVIDVAQRLNTKTVGADTPFTFSGTPASGQWFGVEITNSDTAAHTMTIPSSLLVNATPGGVTTTQTLPASGKILLNWRYDGSAYNLYAGGGGSPGGSSGDYQYNNAGAFGGRTPGTGVNTAFQNATNGTGGFVTFSGALGTPLSGVLANETGLPLTTGVTGLLPIANGGTATATPGLVQGSNITITGTWPNQTITAAGGGSGTVTHTGNLTSNAVVLGNGTADTKVVAGVTTDGTSVLNLGVAGASVGGVALANATSGSVTIQPATGALGSSILTAPAHTGTLLDSSTAVTVSQGGTGVASLTAYAPIFGGTTSTGAVQSGTAGAARQLLRSTGAGSLPVWTTETFAVPGASGNVMKSDGTNWTSGTVTAGAGGADTQIQYNSSGALAGSSGLTWDNTNNTVSVLSTVGGGAGFNAVTARTSSATGYAQYVLRNDQNSAVRALAIGYAGSSYAGAGFTNGFVGEAGYFGTTGAFPIMFGTNNIYRLGINSSGQLLYGLNSAAGSESVRVYRNDASTSEQVRIEQAGAGDPVLSFVLTGITSAGIGLDKSDSNSFKIGDNLDIGTNTFFKHNMTTGKTELFATGTNQDIGFTPSGTGSVTSTGTVNVSGSSPLNAFIGRCTSSTGYVQYQLRNDQNSAVRSLTLGYSGSAYSGTFFTTGGATGESANVFSAGAFPLQFGTNNTFSFLVNSSQEVQIGNTTDLGAFKLQVTGGTSTDSINVGTSVASNSGGIKHSRVTTGSIGAGATSLITVTWGTAFADANYTVSASVVDSTTSSLSLSVVHVESITASAVTVRVLNNAVGSLTGTLHVIAMHD